MMCGETDCGSGHDQVGDQPWDGFKLALEAVSTRLRKT